MLWACGRNGSTTALGPSRRKSALCRSSALLARTRTDPPCSPTARAVRQRRIIAYEDRPGFDANHAEAARRLLRDLDLHAIVAVPLMHVGGPLGALALGWDVPRHLAPAEVLTLTTLAGYTAQALDRAQDRHRAFHSHVKGTPIPALTTS